jgi:hypothetical protein
MYVDIVSFHSISLLNALGGGLTWSVIVEAVLGHLSAEADYILSKVSLPSLLVRLVPHVASGESGRCAEGKVRSGPLALRHAPL